MRPTELPGPTGLPPGAPPPLCGRPEGGGGSCRALYAGVRNGANPLMRPAPRLGIERAALRLRSGPPAFRHAVQQSMQGIVAVFEGVDVWEAVGGRVVLVGVLVGVRVLVAVAGAVLDGVKVAVRVGVAVRVAVGGAGLVRVGVREALGVREAVGF